MGASTDTSAHTTSHGDTGTFPPVPQSPDLPPDAAHAVERLNSSPRHGEYVMIPIPGKGKTDSLRAWLVYPSRSDRAPVVVVIHEIFGMSSWVRAVTDQLASAGYIAIAPDLLTQQQLPGTPDNVSMQDGIAAVSKLNMDDVQHQIDAAARYATSLPAALPKYAIIGFCWGGGVAFAHAAHAPTVATVAATNGEKHPAKPPALQAAVVYYGTAPTPAALSKITAPVLGLYGGNDARVTTTIPPADSVMRALGKTFEHHVYPGAEHGFLRAQGGANGANLRATQQAWPATLAWLRKYLGA